MDSLQSKYAKREEFLASVLQSVIIGQRAQPLTRRWLASGWEFFVLPIPSAEFALQLGIY